MLDLGKQEPNAVPLAEVGRVFFFFNMAGELCSKNEAGTVQVWRGLPGANGDVGPQGPQGLAGADGQNGLNGISGDVGAQGPIGLSGAPGAPGAVGAEGPQGVAGVTPARWNFVSGAIADVVNSTADINMATGTLNATVSATDSIQSTCFGVIGGVTGSGNVVPFIKVGATKIASSIAHAAGTNATSQFLMRWNMHLNGGNLNAICELFAYRTGAYVGNLSGVITTPYAAGNVIAVGVNMSTAVAAFAIRPRGGIIARAF